MAISTVTQCLLLLLYYSYVPPIVADPSPRPELPHKTSQELPYNAELRSFPNDRLYRAYHVIQRFKSTITADPKNTTATWTGYDICGNTTYLGFFCLTPTGRAEDLTVAGIIWNGYGLRAPTLQGFIDKLPDLAFFHSASNYFTGDVPHLDSLPYLYNLDVDKEDIPVHPNSANFYTDSTIHGGGRCINGDIHLRINVTLDPHMKRWGWGMIPAGATSARALLLNYNDLSGALPANIGFSKLSYFALANNKLTGPIPSSIGQAKDTLFELLLLNNQLSGCLPHELGMLTKTTVIDAGKNQLTGPIPPSFSCLSSVEQLNLGENRLYGQVPDALCKLGRLANLTLAGNYFSSVGPACSALIKEGVLDVKRNCIPGLANQRAPAECTSFMSQPKASCPAASAPVSCPAEAAADAKKMAPEGRAAAKDYASYVTYATLHE
ncbi:uncharacterized protein At4g06744 [Brachypodium distachyon]|uniref:Leucine-rich repeat-containing N-terminal plant-type domain-containing protein n=1 Tax=Brachypodium distachyon TaxID=15368 RepID=A0A0Q3FQH5_BRADI|nr:uncharacterized protein At4g06744 [Brachypodium distachyon]KQK00349.1 hypothetical protein BRADI_3g48800v3 [Brachypodium distachyon]|eukprot:XP_003575361.1 uncharacterized protein At4g06744 [Brachypodium distachyon]